MLVGATPEAATLGAAVRRGLDKASSEQVLWAASPDEYSAEAARHRMGWRHFMVDGLRLPEDGEYHPEILIEVAISPEGSLQLRPSQRHRESKARDPLEVSAQSSDAELGRALLELSDSLVPQWPIEHSGSITVANGRLLAHAFVSVDITQHPAPPFIALPSLDDVALLANSIREVLATGPLVTAEPDPQWALIFKERMGDEYPRLRPTGAVHFDSDRAGRLDLCAMKYGPNGAGHGISSSRLLAPVDDVELVAALGAAFRAATSAPDVTSPFGYKTAWLSVRSGDSAAIISALSLRPGHPATWATATELVAGETDAVMVTPPVSAWTFLVTPAWIGRRPDIADLSRQLGAEVCFFETHRVTEMHGWARAVKGKITREFEYVGEQGTRVSTGAITAAERRLGIGPAASYFPSGDEDPAVAPTEETVMRLFNAWVMPATTMTPAASSSEPTCDVRALS
ncbi:MAG: hypothetical protein JF887_07850 [Candidatus Dormibacteraeota bacterium]|uniref:Uncharacterized protein n=1 Tax=Candidatus Amunia macphersoniae TaxID=3127014 RepID=A0A934KIC5_9BACT|nr:hypothetical protein [Candidatus Dormibacteraeota bacterium]